MRKRKPEKRDIKADRIYKSELISLLINNIMRKGKKNTAEKIVYSALEKLSEKAKSSKPLEVFFKALENVKPQVQVKSRRVGGATYQVPVEVDESKQVNLAIRWLIQFSRAKKGTPMFLALSNEIFDAFNNTGNAVKKKEDTHKMASANKAFAHFRW